MKGSKRLLAIGVLLTGMNANADIDDALDNMFATTGNEPTIYQSQRRYGYDFGTLRLRAPVATYQISNLTPPVFRAGCGGIDMYGGSFTFINDEQFRQMLRQIGANALGYAFQLALSSMCKSCSDTLNRLQDKIDQLNRMQMDTCKMAKGFVSDFARAFPESFDEEWKVNETSVGTFGDGFDAMKQVFTEWDEPVNGGNASGADPNKRDKTGNYTWNAVFVTNAGGNFTFLPGNIDNNELLMNIAGTFIFTRTDTEEEKQDIEPRLSYEQLKFGKRSNIDGTEDAAPLYQCDADPNDQCLDPIQVANWSFEGVTNWAESKLQEAADHMADPATAGTAHSAELQEFLATLPIGVVRHMMVMQGDAGALNQYVQNVKEYVGSVYASTLALSMVDVIMVAYEDERTPKMPPLVRENLLKFENDAKEDKLEVERRYAEKWIETEVLVARLTQGYSQPGYLIRNSKGGAQ